MDERRATDPVMLDALESVRAEVAALRDDMREDSRDLRAELRETMLSHAREHRSEAEHLSSLVADAEQAHIRFETFIRNAELAQARRDGYLGIFRFVVELLGRYYKPLGALVLALAFAAAAVSGALVVEIGVRP